MSKKTKKIGKRKIFAIPEARARNFLQSQSQSRSQSQIVKPDAKKLENKNNFCYNHHQGGQHMEKSSYQKIRQKMEKIKRWLIIKQDKFQGKDPVSELMKKYLSELEAIIYEKSDDSAS